MSSSTKSSSSSSMFLFSSSLSSSKLCLHDSLALGQYEHIGGGLINTNATTNTNTHNNGSGYGISNNSTTTTTNNTTTASNNNNNVVQQQQQQLVVLTDEMRRLPTLLRLLSSSRPLSSISNSFHNNHNNNNTNNYQKQKQQQQHDQNNKYKRKDDDDNNDDNDDDDEDVVMEDYLSKKKENKKIPNPSNPPSSTTTTTTTADYHAYGDVGVDGDILIDTVVNCIEDCAAMYPVAEGIEVISCHLSTHVCKKISRMQPLKRIITTTRIQQQQQKEQQQTTRYHDHNNNYNNNNNNDFVDNSTTASSSTSTLGVVVGKRWRELRRAERRHRQFFEAINKKNKNKKTTTTTAAATRITEAETPDNTSDHYHRAGQHHQHQQHCSSYSDDDDDDDEDCDYDHYYYYDYDEYGCDDGTPATTNDLYYVPYFHDHYGGCSFDTTDLMNHVTSMNNNDRDSITKLRRRRSSNIMIPELGTTTSYHCHDDSCATAATHNNDNKNSNDQQQQNIADNQGQQDVGDFDDDDDDNDNDNGTGNNNNNSNNHRQRRSGQKKTTTPYAMLEDHEDNALELSVRKTLFELASLVNQSLKTMEDDASTIIVANHHHHHRRRKNKAAAAVATTTTQSGLLASSSSFVSKSNVNNNNSSTSVVDHATATVAAGEHNVLTAVTITSVPDLALASTMEDSVFVVDARQMMSTIIDNDDDYYYPPEHDNNNNHNHNNGRGASHRHDDAATAAAAVLGGGGNTSDLGSTLVSIMHHAPVFRHQHVASAICRAGIPKGPELIVRMGANCPTAVPSLLRGCIRIYQWTVTMEEQQQTTMTSSSKSTITTTLDRCRDVCYHSIRALTTLSSRDACRIAMILDDEDIMIDIRIRIYINHGDPIAALCTIIRYMSLLSSTTGRKKQLRTKRRKELLKCALLEQGKKKKKNRQLPLLPKVMRFLVDELDNHHTAPYTSPSTEAGGAEFLTTESTLVSKQSTSQPKATIRKEQMKQQQSSWSRTGIVLMALTLVLRSVREESIDRGGGGGNVGGGGVGVSDKTLLTAMDRLVQSLRKEVRRQQEQRQAANEQTSDEGKRDDDDGNVTTAAKISPSPSERHHLDRSYSLLLCAVVSTTAAAAAVSAADCNSRNVETNIVTEEEAAAAASCNAAAAEQQRQQPDAEKDASAGEGSSLSADKVNVAGKDAAAAIPPNDGNDTAATEPPNAEKDTDAAGTPDAEKGTSAAVASSSTAAAAAKPPNDEKDTTAAEQPNAEEDTAAAEPPNDEKDTTAAEQIIAETETAAAELPSAEKDTVAAEPPNAEKDTAAASTASSVAAAEPQNAENDAAIPTTAADPSAEKKAVPASDEDDRRKKESEQKQSRTPAPPLYLEGFSILLELGAWLSHSSSAFAARVACAVKYGDAHALRVSVDETISCGSSSRRGDEDFEDHHGGYDDNDDDAKLFEVFLLKFCDVASYSVPSLDDIMHRGSSVSSFCVNPTAHLACLTMCGSMPKRVKKHRAELVLCTMVHDKTCSKVFLRQSTTPKIIAVATSILIGVDSIDEGPKIPLVLSSLMEQTAPTLDLDPRIEPGDRESLFLLRLLYCFTFVDLVSATSPFAFNPRVLPLREVYAMCETALTTSSNHAHNYNEVAIELRICIRRHCPEVQVRGLWWHEILQRSSLSLPSGFQGGRLRRSENTLKRKHLYFKALRKSISSPDVDPSGSLAEQAFSLAAYELSDSDLYTTTMSAILSHNNTRSPPLYFTYPMLYRDPLIVLKCPMDSWIRPGIRRIIIAILSSLLETNDSLDAKTTRRRFEDGSDDTTRQELDDARDVLIVRSLLNAVTCDKSMMGGRTERRLRFRFTCTATCMFIRKLIAGRRGLTAMLLKQGITTRAVDWLVEHVPETMEDHASLVWLLSDRSSLTSTERLLASDGILRIAIAHGHAHEEESEMLAYAAMSQLLASFFLVLGPVGVPVSSLLGCSTGTGGAVDGGGFGQDAVQSSRMATFRILGALLHVRRYRTRFKNECGMALQKLVTMCKSENANLNVVTATGGGGSGSTASGGGSTAAIAAVKQKALIKEIQDAAIMAADSMGYGLQV